MVDNAAARGIPKKGEILVMRRRAGYSISGLVVWFPSLCSRTFTKKVGKPRLTRWCKSSSTPRTMSPSLEEWRVGYLPGPTQSSFSERWFAESVRLKMGALCLDQEPRKRKDLQLALHAQRAAGLLHVARSAPGRDTQSAQGALARRHTDGPLWAALLKTTVMCEAW